MKDDPDVSAVGAKKFLARAWRLSADVTPPLGVAWSAGDGKARQTSYRLVFEAQRAIESLRFNVAVAKVTELVNAARESASDYLAWQRTYESPSWRVTQPPARQRGKGCSRLAVR